MSQIRPGAALAISVAALLAGCANSTGPGRHSASGSNGAGFPGGALATTATGAKVGEPYEVDGIWYYPHNDPHYDAVGTASWYGEPFHGRATADGEIYDMNGLTAAHTTLPLPSNVEVTNLQNGRSLVLRVNDRGPFVGGRVIDVSRRAAQLLGFEQQGTTQVRVRVMPDAGSNTMLASASGPSVDTRAVVASMPSGNTQLLASPGRPVVPTPPAHTQPVVQVAMAPIADPAPAAVRMAPIANPASEPGASGSSLDAHLVPPQGPESTRGPAALVADNDPGQAGADRTLGSLVPGAARESTYELAQASAPRRAPVRYAQSEPTPRPSRVVPTTVSFAEPSAVPARRPSVTMRWVAGPQPAAIRSDAVLTESGGGDVPYARSTIRPTLASIGPEQAPIADQVVRALAEPANVGRAPGRDGAAVYVQAGAFVSDINAERLRAKLASYGRADVRTTNIGGRVFHRVVMGPMADSRDAERALAMLRQMGHPEAHIVQQ